MIKMELRNLLTQYARLFIASFGELGIREVIISPGSRSTPLALAALRSSDLHCTCILDERDAAFFALGKSKLTGCSPLLLCTSGSAGANYFPAVLEAEAACVPLLIVTADRPLYLAHANAPQTTDQHRLFNHIRFFADFVPQANEEALLAVQCQVAQAVEKAHSVFPGPVQLNFHAAKPLEPLTENDLPLNENERRLVQTVDRLLKRKISVFAPHSFQMDSSEPFLQIKNHLQKSQRGLIVLGPIVPFRKISAATIERLAEQTGFSVFAETPSQFRLQSTKSQLLFPEIFSLFGDDFLLPDCILQIGFPPTGGALNRFLGKKNILRIVFSEGEWGDPSHLASLILHGDIQANLELFLQILSASKKKPFVVQDKNWHSALFFLQKIYSQELQAQLQQVDFCPAHIFEKLGDFLRPQHVLFLGNGMSVRHVDSFLPVKNQQTVICCQRGQNGIDGTVASAFGAIAAAPDGGIAVLGDISCLHNLGGFGAIYRLPPFEKTCVLIVMNNGGGLIFNKLPAAKVWKEGESEFWITPHTLNFSAIASMFGLAYRKLKQKDEVEKTLKEAFSLNKPVIIEAFVREIDFSKSLAVLREEAKKIQFGITKQYATQKFK